MPPVIMPVRSVPQLCGFLFRELLSSPLCSSPTRSRINACIEEFFYLYFMDNASELPLSLLRSEQIEASKGSQHGLKRKEGENSQWLSSEGPYQDIINQYTSLNPGLKTPDPKNRVVGTRIGTSRLVLLEQASSQFQEFHRTQFYTAQEVETFLSGIDRNTPSSYRRIYLFEGLDPHFVQSLGSFYSIDPSFFLRQERHPRLDRTYMFSDLTAYTKP
jgi:hypothetical protein